MTVGDCLNIFIVASSLLKVPQILKISTLKSIDGIAVDGQFMELYSYTILFLYNYSLYGLSSYLDYFLIMCQEWILIYYILKYKNFNWNFLARSICFIYFTVILGYIFKVLPTACLILFVSMCAPLGGIGKGIILRKIISTRQSKAVSLLTWIISILRNSIKLYILFNGAMDLNLLLNYTVSSSLSLAILIASCYYKREEKKKFE